MPSTKRSTPESKRADLLRAVGHDLGRQRSAQGAMFNSRIADALDLNLTDLKCFDLLLRAEKPVSAKQLAHLSGLTTAAITGVMDRLERADFIRRVPHPTDRRQLIVEPLDTAAGRVSALYDPLEQAMMQLAEKYTDEQLEIIADFQAETARILTEETVRLVRKTAENQQKNI